MFEGKISIDKALAYLFGVLFVTVLLIFAAAVPNPTETTFFIFRVVLALAAAGVGAVLPGILEITFPGVRAGGALALAATVFFANPPAIVRDATEQKARAALDSAYAYLNRGNLELARDHVEQSRVLSPEAVDVPFSWASFIRGSTSS